MKSKKVICLLMAAAMVMTAGGCTVKVKVKKNKVKTDNNIQGQVSAGESIMNNVPLLPPSLRNKNTIHISWSFGSDDTESNIENNIENGIEGNEADILNELVSAIANEIGPKNDDVSNNENSDVTGTENNSQSGGRKTYEGLTVRQMLEDEKFELNGVVVINQTNTVSLSFIDNKAGIEIVGVPFKLTDEQMSEFEKERAKDKLDGYKNYVRNNMMDNQISTYQVMYSIDTKEQLRELAGRGNVTKAEEMTGKSLWDLANDDSLNCFWDGSYRVNNEYLINLTNYYVIVDTSGTEFESPAELDKDAWKNKDERLKNVKVQEAYKVNY